MRSQFFPLKSFESEEEKAHGRIEQRRIDVLPACAAKIEKEWPSVRQICRVHRTIQRKEKGEWKTTHETVFLITSLSEEKASPEDLLTFNRDHWKIEIMHRNKDVFLDEDRATSRKGNAPHIRFILNNLVLSLCKSVHKSPTIALETFQNNRKVAFNACS